MGAIAGPWDEPWRLRQDIEKLGHQFHNKDENYQIHNLERENHELTYRVTNLESSLHHLENILSDTVERLTNLENEYITNRSSETK